MLHCFAIRQNDIKIVKIIRRILPHYQSFCFYHGRSPVSADCTFSTDHNEENHTDKHIGLVLLISAIWYNYSRFSCVVRSNRWHWLISKLMKVSPSTSAQLLYPSGRSVTGTRRMHSAWETVFTCRYTSLPIISDTSIRHLRLSLLSLLKWICSGRTPKVISVSCTVFSSSCFAICSGSVITASSTSVS